MKLHFFILFLSLVLLITDCDTIQIKDFKHKKIGLPLILSSSLNNIQNRTGKGVTQARKQTISNIINSAYKFYVQDMRMNSLYIRQQLELFYRNQLYSNSNFSVIIFNSNDASFANFAIWIDVQYFYLMWYKVNNFKPNWVYIIWVNTYSSSYDLYYFDKFQTGSGVDSQRENAIKNIIIKTEKQYESCRCQNVNDIVHQMISLQANTWSVICKSGGQSFMKGFFFAKENTYISTSPNGKCQYLMFL